MPAAACSAAPPCAANAADVRQRIAPPSEGPHHAGRSHPTGQLRLQPPASATVPALPAPRMGRLRSMLTSSLLMLRVCASAATVPAPFSCVGDFNSGSSASLASALLLRAGPRHASFRCPPAARLSSSCHAHPARSCSFSIMTSVWLFYPPSMTRRELTPSSSDRHGQEERSSSRSRADLTDTPPH
jgi:hypothetical protein